MAAVIEARGELNNLSWSTLLTIDRTTCSKIPKFYFSSYRVHISRREPRVLC
uniref:Uncharacterized protein n=1 Tax=Anguilla anguilla TaxID=7936 RepID=A0A0E9RGY5_ANGAN